jgi:L-fucose mutarotase/ribose pyranase (RbsD/FucU family)
MLAGARRTKKIIRRSRCDAEEHRSAVVARIASTLRAMGHGDELAIVDANYPAVSSGRP